MTAGAPVERGAIDFHGVPITLDYEPFALDAFPRLFAGFGTAARAGDALHVSLRAVPEPVSRAVEGFRATFCHGLVQAYSNVGGHVLSDGQSRIAVFPRLGRMSGEVFENSKTNLSAGMQHIALSLLLRERGIFDLHAATACTDHEALILAGDSGAGKTTLLLSLIELGCDFLGDDRLLLRARTNNAELLAYPREFHLSPVTIRLVKRSLGALDDVPPTDGKYSIEPLQIWPERFRRSWSGPIRLVLPHIEQQEHTVVRRVTAAEAFGKLLSSSATVVVDAIARGAEQMAALKLLADTAEAYDVSLGADLLSRPAATTREILKTIESLARWR